MKISHCLAALVLSAACSSPPSSLAVDNGNNDEDDAAVEPLAPFVQFAPSKEDAEAGRFVHDFTLLGQRDIFAVVQLPEPQGTQFVKFDIINPRGTHYSTIWRAISSDSGSPATLLHPTFNQEMPVERLSAKDGFVRLRVSIPVAGTDFTRARLQGEFSVQVTMGLDSTDAPIRNSFSLRR